MANSKKPTISFRAPTAALTAFVEGGQAPLAAPASLDAARPALVAVPSEPVVEQGAVAVAELPQEAPAAPASASAPARSRPIASSGDARARRTAAAAPAAAPKAGGRRTLQRTDGRAVRQHSVYLEVSLSKQLAMRAVEEERDVSDLVAEAVVLYLQR